MSWIGSSEVEDAGPIGGAGVLQVHLIDDTYDL